ncbi:MAG: STAS domain-containing protein [Spirochaetaceae bacterium]
MPKKTDNVVVITDDLIINHVDEIRELLIKTLKKQKKLEVVLSSINRIDISGLQLLVSLSNEAFLAKKEILYSGVFKDSFLFDINKVSFAQNILTNAEDLQNFIKDVV